MASGLSGGAIVSSKTSVIVRDRTDCHRAVDTSDGEVGAKYPPISQSANR